MSDLQKEYERLQNAIGLKINKQENELIQELAKHIKNEEFISALDCVNKLISINSNNSFYYLQRGIIYHYLSEKDEDAQNAVTLERLSRLQFRAAIDTAEETHDAVAKANAQGFLASSMYFNDPTDKDAAEKLALEAKASGKDQWENSKIVLEYAKMEKGNRARQRESELRGNRAEEERRKKQRAEEIRKSQEKEKEESKKATERKRIQNERRYKALAEPVRKGRNFYIFSLVVLAAYTALYFIGVSHISVNYPTMPVLDYTGVLAIFAVYFNRFYFAITILVTVATVYYRFIREYEQYNIGISSSIGVLIDIPEHISDIYLPDILFDIKDFFGALIDLFRNTSFLSVLIGIVLSISYAVQVRHDFFNFLIGVFVTVIAIVFGALIGAIIKKIAQKYCDKKVNKEIERSTQEKKQEIESECEWLEE